MTIEKAIDLLDNLVGMITDNQDSDYDDALKMGIEALKATACNNLATDLQPSKQDDLISRQAAIDALDKRFDNVPMEQTTEILLLRKDLRELPSAQPEPCKDAVSREAVSEWLKQYGQDVLHGKYKFSLMYIWKNLMDLPAVQIKRKNGKWIDNSPVTMKCNQCGFVIKDWDWHRFKCCPNCGANMKGEQDD